MSAMDGFILRRMQSAALLKWQTAGARNVQLEEEQEQQAEQEPTLDASEKSALAEAEYDNDDDHSEQPVEEEEEDEQPEQSLDAAPVPVTPTSITSNSTDDENDIHVDASHAGPRRWTQRTVYTDILAGDDLLDDESDEDLFSFSTPAPPMRHSTGMVSVRSMNPRKAAAPVKDLSSRSTRSVSPCPARRHKVMSYAA